MNSVIAKFYPTSPQEVRYSVILSSVNSFLWAHLKSYHLQKLPSAIANHCCKEIRLKHTSHRRKYLSYNDGLALRNLRFFFSIVVSGICRKGSWSTCSICSMYLANQ